jgi:hypothetical protein
MSKRKAWQHAAAQFPPSELPPPAESGDVTLEDFAGKSSSFPKDVAWVYSHLRVGDVTPEMAPSSGAWGLRLWARRLENTSKFMDFALPSAREELETVPQKEDNPFEPTRLKAIIYQVHRDSLEQAAQGIVPEDSRLVNVLLTSAEEQMIQQYRSALDELLSRPEDNAVTRPVNKRPSRRTTPRRTTARRITGTD